MNCAICNSLNSPDASFCVHCRAPLLLQRRYEIVRQVGSGGFGTVYEARHRDIDTLFAIKEVKPDEHATPQEQAEAEELFRQEAIILAGVHHPALPVVTDFFVENDRHYLVMEYVAGDTLSELLEREGKPLAVERVLGWLEALCDILLYLHTRKPNAVVHRDIKPSNIKLSPSGELKLIDLGIAKFAGARTRPGGRAVSPPYSPLEQYGTGTDPRSDIYALGVTAYQLLTNHLPPEAPDRDKAEVISPSVYNPTVSAEFDVVILKAMARERAERFQDVGEFKQALSKTRVLVAQASTPVPAGATIAVETRPLGRTPTNWLRVVVLGAVGMAIVSFGLGLYVLNGASGVSIPGLFAPSRYEPPTPAVVATSRPTATLRAAFASPSPTRLPTRPAVPTHTPTPLIPTVVTRTSTPLSGRIEPSAWRIRTATDQVLGNGENVPFKTRFWFEIELTNGTLYDMWLDQLIVQVRAREADYVWNLKPREAWSIGIGERRTVQTETLELGTGNFAATLQYRGKALSDSRGAPFTFFFQIAR